MGRAVVVAAMGLAACYGPIAPSGVACGAGGACPVGQQCVASLCQVTPGQPDARVIDARFFDARKVDAAPHACDSTGLACASSVTAASCAGVCFVTCGDLVGKAEAEARCVTWGGHLASVLDAPAESCLESAHPDAAWIGYIQISNQATPAAGWYWTAGQTASFTSWATSEPDDSTGVETNKEQCAFNASGGWHDEICTVTHPFACQ